MEIIKINYKLSKTVVNFNEIKEESKEMREFLRNINTGKTKLAGFYNKAFAIAHCQVSETPYSFFVVSDEVVNEKMFEKNTIINPQILDAQGDENIKEYDEPCLSFPFRSQKKVKRFDKIRVQYQIASSWLGGLKMIERELTGITSEIFQHEYDHTQARNIFFHTDNPRAWWQLAGEHGELMQSRETEVI